MLRFLFLTVFILQSMSRAADAPPPIEAHATGVFVLDDCDDKHEGKVEYKDNLTLLDSAGNQVCRVSGFNNCESIGSSHMVAADSARKCVWVIENVAQRMRRFDLAGKETLTIPSVECSAIAVDPDTGNVWALENEGQIGTGLVMVFDEHGKPIDSYEISGWDIAYDRKAKAFWVAGTKLTKIAAATGEVQFSIDVAKWCSSSVDVDPRTGDAWVATRKHPQVTGSANRLLKFDADGTEQAAVDLEQKDPFRVSVDWKDGMVWVANRGISVLRYSAEGKSQGEYPAEALAVEADPDGGGVWVVTPTETQKLDSNGKVTSRVSHAGTTNQAWIAVLK